MPDINLIGQSKLYDYLPSFYQSDLDNDKFINTLMHSYVEIHNLYKKEVQRVYNDLFLNKIEYFRELPLSVLSLNASLYNITDILSDFYTTTGKSWLAAEATISDKVTYLLAKGHYENLLYTALDGKKLKVYSMNICRDFSELLPKYEYFKDYVIYDNKLFVFNDLAKPTSNSLSKNVLAKNVIMESDKLSSKWGFMVGLEKPNFLSKFQYHNIIRGIIESFRDGAQVSNLKNVVKYIAGSKTEINVYDAYSLDLPDAYRVMYNNNTLCEFDFIIEFPANFAPNATVSDFIINVVKMIKPAYATFAMYSTTVATDDCNLQSAENDLSIELQATYFESSAMLIDDDLLILNDTDTSLNNQVLGIRRKSDENSCYLELRYTNGTLKESYDL